MNSMARNSGKLYCEKAADCIRELGFQLDSAGRVVGTVEILSVEHLLNIVSEVGPVILTNMKSQPCIELYDFWG